MWCEDVKMWRCEDVKMWRWEDVKMWGFKDVMWRCEDVRMWRCDKMWGCEDVRIFKDVKMWGCEDDKMWRWEDVKVWCEHEKIWRCEEVKMWGCEDLKMWCEDVKMFDRPQLLEEPFAQTLSGKWRGTTDGAPWLSTGLYTYRTNPSVWIHCLGKIKQQKHQNHHNHPHQRWPATSDKSAQTLPLQVSGHSETWRSKHWSSLPAKTVTF